MQAQEALDPNQKAKKARDRKKIENLPSELTQHANKWKFDVLPVLFSWVSSLKNAWDISPPALVNALTIICQACVRKDYTLKRDGDQTGDQSPEYHLVCSPSPPSVS